MNNSDSDDDVAGNIVQEEEWDPKFPERVLLNSNRITPILLQRIELGRKRNPILDTVPRSLRRRRRSTSMTINPYGRERLPKKFAGLTQIYVNDMDITAEAPVVGKRVELEIIEAATAVDQIRLVGQDANATVVLVVLYTRNPNKRDYYLQEKIGYGTRISIGNPLLVQGVGLLPTLKVQNDENFFIYKAMDSGKCRFCTKPGPNAIKCDGCDRVFYCSKRCHQLDWSNLKHHLICQNESSSKKEHEDERSFWLSVGPIPMVVLIALGFLYYYLEVNGYGINEKIGILFSKLWEIIEDLLDFYFEYILV